MAVLDLWGPWLWFAGIALGLTTVLCAVVYMLSELLQNDKMKGWAKMELSEVVYSAIIISMAISAIGLIDAVVQGSLGVSNTGATTGGMPGCQGSSISAWVPVSDTGSFGGGHEDCYRICAMGTEDLIGSNPDSVYHGVESCHMRLGIWYLREVFNEAKTFAFDIYLNYIKTSMIAEFTINIEFLFEKAGFFTFTPWKGFYTMGNKIKEMSFDWAVKLMMVTKFQEVMLRFIATALFPGFFVIGALLRTFPFTRRLGGLMLAMAIALYFIFPSFYAFGALIMLDLKNDPEIWGPWLSDTDRNPGGFHNPPIANVMYLRGEMPIPGGSGKYNYSQAQELLRNYEGLDSRTYMTYMEQGSDGTGALIPLADNSGRTTDISSRTTHTDAERDAAMAASRAAADSWFDSVSRESAFDRFVEFAWEPNGPLDTLARITFWSLFFAMFSVLATIAGIRSLSMTFGGDIEIAGLTRLI